MKQINTNSLVYDISYFIGKGQVAIHDHYLRLKRAAYDNPEMVMIFVPIGITLIGEIWRNQQIRKFAKIVSDLNGME